MHASEGIVIITIHWCISGRSRRSRRDNCRCCCCNHALDRSGFELRHTCRPATLAASLYFPAAEPADTSHLAVTIEILSLVSTTGTVPWKVAPTGGIAGAAAAYTPNKVGSTRVAPTRNRFCALASGPNTRASLNLVKSRLQPAVRRHDVEECIRRRIGCLKSCYSFV